MEIDLELTEKSAKNTQRWWKLTATIVSIFATWEKKVRIGLCLKVSSALQGLTLINAVFLNKTYCSLIIFLINA